MTFDLSIAQAVGVWSDLCDAYYGQNGYGGDVAEIYAYRLQPYNPTIALGDNNDKFSSSSLYQSAIAEASSIAAKNLTELLMLFKQRYTDCTIKIDGKTAGKWFNKTQFDHRCRVEIKRREDNHG